MLYAATTRESKAADLKKKKTPTFNIPTSGSTHAVKLVGVIVGSSGRSSLIPPPSDTESSTFGDYFRLHALIFELGMDTCNVKVGTMIMDMYCKFGRVDLASVNFREIVKNIKITWNTMINGCLRNEEFERVVKVLDEMFDRDVIIHTTLIDGFIKRDLFDVAFEWFQDAAD